MASRPHLEPLAIVAVLATTWAGGFGWLALQRHLADGSHAEDLGFTEQVLSNFLRGQWFRMSIYQGATWNTEIDVSRIARPDSLLAFHFEPMLLLLVPLYAVGGMSLLLVLQAVAVAVGALPAYRLASYATGSSLAGLAVAAAYLLSPLGQWAVLDDLHTSTLAAPLLVLAVERLVVKGSLVQATIAGGLAASAREDAGLVVATLGAVVLVRYLANLRRARDARLACGRTAIVGSTWLVCGVLATALGTLTIRAYDGAGLPFAARYADTLGRGPSAAFGALERPEVLVYARTLLLGGGWLGLAAPLALVPALPSLALNALSTSPWMAAGKAHYSSLVLPFVVVGAAAGLRRVRARPRVVAGLSGALILSSALGYWFEGSGPLAANYAPALLTEHAQHADTLAQSVPLAAAVSATSALVPHLTRRAHVYVFPAVLDAEYILIDLHASPSPTSAGDVYLRTQALVAGGGWQIHRAADGLLLLQRAAAASPSTTSADQLKQVLIPPQSALDADATDADAVPVSEYADGRVSLLSARLVPPPDGAVGVDGPHWILRTTWRAEQPLPAGSHLDFWVTLRNGQQVHLWDIASLWWRPPAQWTAGQPVTIDVPDVPIREFVSWRAAFASAAADATP